LNPGADPSVGLLEERIVKKEEERRNRYLGSLVGLAVGDALGAPLEFHPPGTFEPIEDMVEGGAFNLQAGQWTDDTAMALCLADSLNASEGFDPVDQLRRYVRWFRNGYLSSTGKCFGIGNTVRAALVHFEKTGAPYCEVDDPYAAGNGSIMRLAPVPMFYAGSPKEAIARSEESSRTTHGARTCGDACRYFGGLLVGTLNGVDKETLLSDHYSPLTGYWANHPLGEEIAEIAAGSFKHKKPPQILGSGYVVKSLEAALWAFYSSHSFKEGALMAVNLGNDADTTGAVYGQIAGAFYGYQGIPQEWRTRIAHRDLIESNADQLYRLGADLENRTD
jgi:ADP-ribosyl-[dinitrogen reductase] hydrolase